MMGLLTADDGHLSLSKVQMALWTVAVGAVVGSPSRCCAD